MLEPDVIWLLLFGEWVSLVLNIWESPPCLGVTLLRKSYLITGAVMTLVSSRLVFYCVQFYWISDIDLFWRSWDRLRSSPDLGEAISWFSFCFWPRICLLRLSLARFYMPDFNCPPLPDIKSFSFWFLIGLDYRKVCSYWTADRFGSGVGVELYMPES